MIDLLNLVAATVDRELGGCKDDEYSLDHDLSMAITALIAPNQIYVNILIVGS